jgi:hypothetical protein
MSFIVGNMLVGLAELPITYYNMAGFFVKPTIKKEKAC